MPKEYNNMWVFGDSYTTPGVCVIPKESFWGLAATKLKINTIKNCSRPGNSFDSVCYLLVSMQQEIDWQKDILMIGIPPLERITVFDNFKDTAYYGIEFTADQDWQQESFQIAYHHGLVGLQNYGSDKQLILYSDRSWLETQTLRTIFLLTTWLDSVKANYVLINLSKDFDKNNIWGPSNFVLPYSVNHPKCILFENTYYGINLDVNAPADFDKFGWHGHHGAVGNQYFFEKSLLPVLTRNNFC